MLGLFEGGVERDDSGGEEGGVASWGAWISVANTWIGAGYLDEDLGVQRTRIEDAAYVD